MITESIQEKDITIINIYAPNIGAPQMLKKKKVCKTNTNKYERGN